MSCGGSCNCSTKPREFPTALTYDDIQLSPRFSDIESRAKIDISTTLSSIQLETPIIAAPMESVCDFDMAKKLGERGALGILHRFSDEEEQAHYAWKLKQLGLVTAAAVGSKESDMKRVSKLLNNKIDLLCIDVAHGHHKMVKDTIKRIRQLSDSVHIMAGSICTDGAAKDLIDWGANSLRVGVGGGCFIPGTLVNTENGFKKIEDVVEGDKVWTHMRRLRKVQQIHKYHRKEEIVQINGIIDCTKNHEFYIMRARKGYWMPAAQLKLIAATSGTGTFHGWSLLDCRNELLMPLDSVTFKFYEGHVYDLSVEEDFSYNVFNIACHNSMCTTRINTGFGVPQVTAIMECCRVADQFNIPVIADGGVRYPGDVVKAIGLGSSAVMLGNLLAGTDESPGSLKRLGSFGQETLVKTYRGSASLESKLARGEEGKNVEGVATLVSYKGSVDNVLTALTDGLRSGMSYAGAMSIPEFWARAKFVRVTNAGVVEASPHGQNKVAKI